MTRVRIVCKRPMDQEEWNLYFDFLPRPGEVLELETRSGAVIGPPRKFEVLSVRHSMYSGGATVYVDERHGGY